MIKNELDFYEELEKISDIWIHYPESIHTAMSSYMKYKITYTWENESL